MAGRKKKLNAGVGDRSSQRKRSKNFKESQKGLKDLQKSPPGHLDATAKRLWRLIYPELIKLETIKEIDIVTFEVYCTTYSMYREAEKQIQNTGMFILNDEGLPVKKSPQAMMISDCARTLKSMGADLGLSFDSRSGQVSVANSPVVKTESELSKVRKVIDIGSRV